MNTRKLFFLQIILVLAFLMGWLYPGTVQASRQTVWSSYIQVNLWQQSGAKFNGSVGCLGNCLYYFQRGGIYTLSWGKWRSSGYTFTTNFNWRAHIPQSQSGVGKAVVRYYFYKNGDLSPSSSVIIAQHQYSGWTYIGAAYSCKSSQMSLNNECVPGYACNNLEVEWDKAAYSYWISP